MLVTLLLVCEIPHNLQNLLANKAVSVTLFGHHEWKVITMLASHGTGNLVSTSPLIAHQCALHVYAGVSCDSSTSKFPVLRQNPAVHATECYLLLGFRAEDFPLCSECWCTHMRSGSVHSLAGYAD
jgi:hypothetical protein